MQTLSPPSQGISEVMSDPLEALDAVILYDAIAAGRRGMSTLSCMTGLRETDLFEIRPRPWRLDFLQDPATSKNAMHDIRAAHVIILSTSRNSPLSLEFKIWFATILAQKRGERVAVIALLGTDEKSARAASLDLHFIQQLTLEAELDFFAPSFNY